LQGRGIKFGLHNIKTLLRSVGNPERKFHSVHIAGTNGKGSTASFIASVMMEGGYKTGLYTSPHLVRFTERVKVDGDEIAEHRLIDYANRLRPEIEKVHATFFEATTCIAFQYFADEEVDIAVVETGLGGRLDATNVLKPLISVITSISFDHMGYLGNNLRSIAREKGGIIKNGVPCVTGRQTREALDTLKRIAEKRRVRLHEAHKLVKGNAKSSRIGNLKVSLASNRLKVDGLKLGLAGAFQFENATVALSAMEILLRKRWFSKRFDGVSSRSVGRGLLNVQKNTGLHGRLETLKGDRRIVLDVAHNAEAMEFLVIELQSRSDNLVTAVFGVMADKDYGAMIASLSRVAKRVIAVTPRIQRALKSSRLCSYARRNGIHVLDGGTVKGGIRKAKKLADPAEKILITGSHYVVGEALQYLHEQTA
ncbi:MAG: bifunctional folylpolyglutamate synthase/dihydrofolate synthase, partial [Ignavibacteriae bacterium]|nr:bifunctional folylpolyglutamate synthase/dihydrofolate synthase [Ignavibacteriota bacterium]